jgi:hypothetical protein
MYTGVICMGKCGDEGIYTYHPSRAGADNCNSFLLLGSHCRSLVYYPIYSKSQI